MLLLVYFIESNKILCRKSSKLGDTRPTILVTIQVGKMMK